ncbi:MAG: hypothetical protein NDI75_06625 [Candidatus Didemnitutus sp.]|nr:hypothetical protein [Candidatus Didemnitutus sp.]
MKVRLVLLGGLSVGAITACAPTQTVAEPRISPESAYGNDHFIAGAGYYHAPFRGFYPRPYNQYDPVTRKYYYDGAWHDAPHESVINMSTPTDSAATLAQAMRTDIPRGGFGNTSTYRGGGYS